MSVVAKQLDGSGFRIPLGTEVCLGPGDAELDGSRPSSAPHGKRHSSPHFSANSALARLPISAAAEHLLHSSRQSFVGHAWHILSLPLKIVPLIGAIWTNTLHTVPWVHPSPNPKRHLERFRHFLQSSRQRVAILYNCMAAPFHLKISPSYGDVNPPPI